MPVRIRLARRGRRNLAIFDIVVADSRSPRDGKFIERLGLYNPLTNPAIVEFNEEKAFQWIMNGAQPTDTVRNILSERGILLKKHLQVGVIKGAISQDQADKKYEEWKKKKEASLTEEKVELSKKKDEERKSRLAAEAKVNEARKEAIKKKNIVPDPEAAAAETPAEAPAAEAPAQEEKSE
jgi:small subunit ribosomal protein S16